MGRTQGPWPRPLQGCLRDWWQRMRGLKAQRPAGSSPSLRTRAGTPAGTEAPTPGPRAETGRRSRSGTLAETEQDTPVKTRHGFQAGTGPIPDQTRPGWRGGTEALSRDGQPAETEARIRPGTRAGTLDESGPHQGQSRGGERVEAKNKPGPAETESGDLVGTQSQRAATNEYFNYWLYSWLIINR